MWVSWERGGVVLSNAFAATKRVALSEQRAEGFSSTGPVKGDALSRPLLGPVGTGAVPSTTIPLRRHGPWELRDRTRAGGPTIRARQDASQEFIL